MVKRCITSSERVVHNLRFIIIPSLIQKIIIETKMKETMKETYNLVIDTIIVETDKNLGTLKTV